jgi:hypothetical protein
VKRDLGPLRFFNAANPTGHYSLNLACATDYAVAQQLLDLNAREMADKLHEIKKHEGCWRNVTLQTEPIEDFDPLTYKVTHLHPSLRCAGSVNLLPRFSSVHCVPRHAVTARPLPSHTGRACSRPSHSTRSPSPFTAERTVLTRGTLVCWGVASKQLPSCGVLRLDYVTYRGLVEDTAPLRALRRFTVGKMEAFIHVLCTEPPADGLDVLSRVDAYYHAHFSDLYASAMYRSTWRPTRVPEEGEPAAEEAASPKALQTELSEAVFGEKGSPPPPHAGPVVSTPPVSTTHDDAPGSSRGSSASTSAKGSPRGEESKESEHVAPVVVVPSLEEMTPVLAIQPGTEAQVSPPQSRHLESRPKAAARLVLDLSARRASPSSRGLWGGRAVNPSRRRCTAAGAELHARGGDRVVHHSLARAATHGPLLATRAHRAGERRLAPPKTDGVADSAPDSAHRSQKPQCSAYSSQLAAHMPSAGVARSQVVQIWYSRVVDRRNMGRLVRALPPSAQRLVGLRLGVVNVMHRNRPDAHYTLRLSHPDELEVRAGLIPQSLKLNRVLKTSAEPHGCRGAGGEAAERDRHARRHGAELQRAQAGRRSGARVQRGRYAVEGTLVCCEQQIAPSALGPPYSTSSLETQHATRGDLLCRLTVAAVFRRC